MSDFSCVVTEGGGEAALRTSVESVLGQSLRAGEALVVLAAQGDPATRATARALAGGAAGRVRVIVAGPEARSTAALRNVGLDAATGRYVLVLGTGERLQRHACRNLWEAGERTRADLVAGRWSRVTAEGGKEQEPPWQERLYARSRTVGRWTEAPELAVRDALVTGFCLRREALERHGLRYAEDLGHSEILFGPVAAAAVGRIALVRRLIVSGRTVPDRGRDIAALAEAHRRAMDALVAQGLHGLRSERERAFARDHLVPLARTFPRLPAAERARAAEAAARALDGPVPPDLPPLERVAVHLLARGDADGLLAAAYALSRPGTVAAPLTASGDGRVYWEIPGADGHGPTRVDVSELGHQYREFGELRLMNRLTRCTGDAGRLLLEGHLVLPSRTGPDPARPLTARLEFRVRGGTRAFTLPVDELRRGPAGIAWRTRADVTRVLRPAGGRDTVWDARMTVEAGGTRSVSDLFAPQDLTEGGTGADGPVRLRARPRLGPLAGETWQPYVTVKDHLALRLLARRRPARVTRSLVHYATHFRPARRARLLRRALRTRLERYRSRGFKAPVYNTWLCRLPMRRGSVVFESHMGKCYGDSPRAIHEEIRRQGLRLRPVWSYENSPTGFPGDARLVRRWSWRYLWALARAEYWVDNQGFPQHLRKPARTTYLQTWHGSAYKRMGFDETRVRMQNAPQRHRLQEAVHRFDHFLVRSEHDVRTLAHAYRLPEERLLRTGYPRNDVLFAERARDEAEGRLPRGPLAEALGLPDHRRTVLYAPTFRGGPGKYRKRRLPLDIARFAERFGDEYTLLVRAHYLEEAKLPACPPGTVLDVSHHHDVGELLTLADVLITDYSSIMFDFALLDRPIVLFAPDLDGYTATRGSYFDLRKKAPGPVAGTEEELFAALAELKEADTEFGPARAAFAAEFGGYDRGDAARQVVGTVFARHTIRHQEAGR
ncbi:CDP-glycerol glycerophosphotransferase family protein [Streptomyces sp. NBC_00654]|uniref:bifunctional glycosyltransferase/CDP-glycerol:glycerophosphate glycerophosphotransferase n=1 Tax=Streptomyces sp. NBC_00654 TaxID=2975799 RepID=UPI00224CBC7B|nr:CDP-glycerol glycerophosphotransferase family protein [Streptomyces sp. NBC_00654]MCX4969709.1 CDP-glycerol glycerophosphotransferase family protein [Streptomyces sp. NBC_00654]